MSDQKAKVKSYVRRRLESWQHAAKSAPDPRGSGKFAPRHRKSARRPAGALGATVSGLSGGTDEQHRRAHMG